MIVDAAAMIQDGYTALFFATLERQHVVMQVLLQAAADANLQADSDGAAPLLHASGSGDLRAVEILVEGGADPNVRSKVGVAPMHLACRNDELAIAEALLHAGASVDIETMVRAARA